MGSRFRFDRALLERKAIRPMVDIFSTYALSFLCEELIATLDGYTYKEVCLSLFLLGHGSS